MQTAIHLPKEQALAASAVAKPKAARLKYLDTLRVILICMVIAQHTAITYGASGSWIYTDPVKNDWLMPFIKPSKRLVRSFCTGSE